MRIKELGPHLTQITRWPVAFPMNCYLVQEEDGLTLVDGTISSPAEDVAALAKRLGKQLRRVTLTHAHGDHVGGVASLRKTFPGVEVSIFERDARLLAGDKTLLPAEPQTPVKGSFVKIDWKPRTSSSANGGTHQPTRAATAATSGPRRTRSERGGDATTGGRHRVLISQSLSSETFCMRVDSA